MTAPVVAVLDACVLYPPALRDFLMWLAVGFVYDLRLTDAIHDEWIRNTLINQPHLTPTRLVRTRALMNAISPSVLITDYEAQIPDLTLPDPNDRHVLAAAIQGGASLIVTFNLKDFPVARLAPYGLTAIHPDAFVRTLMTDATNRAQVVAMARQGRQSLKNPPKTVAEYLETLRRQQLNQVVMLLEEHQSEL